MPRPKRSKIAPSEPTRVPEPTIPSSIALNSESSTRALSDHVTTNSDDSEGLVTRSRPGVNRRGVEPQEATMTGALAQEDLAGGRLKPIRGRKRAELSRIAREGDHAKAIAALEARRNAALAKEKAEKEQAALARTSAVPDTQDLQPRLQSPVRETENGAPKPAASETGNVAANVRLPHPATAIEPFRRESTILADFKRKPRQPSLLAMVSAQHLQQADESHSDDSLNDLQPEDESTPFIKATSQPVRSTPSAQSTSLQQSSGARKRKLAAIEPEIQVPASQPSPSQPSSPPAQPTSELSQYDIPADDDPPLPVIQSTQLSSQLETSPLAAPLSSSPAPQPVPKSKSTRSKAPPQPKAPTRVQPSRALSPPLSPQSSTSTHPSPVRPSSKPSTLKPLTTASLQNLLPRRRVVRSRTTEFDIPSSSDVEASSDQDELSFQRAPQVRANGKKGVVGGAKAAGSVPRNKKGRVSATYGRQAAVERPADRDDGGSDAQRSEGDEVLDPVKGRPKGRATYGKGGAAVQGEMKRLARKFREVDEWALEIEDVTPHSGSSQMVDAR